jgi:hypothetical protein
MLAPLSACLSKVATPRPPARRQEDPVLQGGIIEAGRQRPLTGQPRRFVSGIAARAMADLPASHKVDTALLKTVAGATAAGLASELEFKSLFFDCEAGAMPPFGNLYGLQVFVEESLAKDEEIAFNAGSHSELVRLSYKDFERLVRPTAAKFSLRP